MSETRHCLWQGARSFSCRIQELKNSVALLAYTVIIQGGVSQASAMASMPPTIEERLLSPMSIRVDANADCALKVVGLIFTAIGGLDVKTTAWTVSCTITHPALLTSVSPRPFVFRGTDNSGNCPLISFQYWVYDWFIFRTRS